MIVLKVCVGGAVIVAVDMHLYMMDRSLYVWFCFVGLGFDQ